MILNSRSNLFVFGFPKNFMVDEVAQKYKKYLDRMPGNLVSRPIDYINYAVQSITFPSYSYEPVQQQFREDLKSWRDSTPMREILTNELTVTFQMLDGYINYWMMLDLFLYWYSFPNPNPYIPHGISLRILDTEGNIMITIEFEEVLFKEVSSLDLSFSNNSPEFTTFDCTFTYNQFNSKLELD
jgi:hypothetical protein